MPGAGDIGYYTLPVIPSFRGIESQTESALTRAFGGAGGKAGEAFNTGAKSAITNADILTAAYSKVKTAQDKAADAAGKWRVETEKLHALQAGGVTGGARLVAQQERLATSYRKSQGALNDMLALEGRYESFKKNLTDPQVPGFFERLGAHLRGRSAEVKKLGGEMGELAGKMGGVEVGTASLGRFGGVVSEITGLMGSAGGAALGMVTGIATLGTTAYEVEKRFYDLGREFDSTFNRMRIQTGQTGEGLRDLENATINISKRSPEGIGEIGNTVAAVSRATHLTGRDLEALSHQIGTLGRLTGQPIDVRRMGQLFRGFGIGDVQQEQDTVNQLFRAYQNTGIGVNELIDTLVRGHAQFKDFHLDLGQSAALLATLQSGGLDSTRAVSGLNIALGNFASAGKDPAAGLAELNKQVHDFEAAGKDPEAAAAVNKIFGKRVGPTIFEQIKAGTLDLAGALDALKNTGDTVDKAAADTDRFEQKWAETKNQVKAAIEPMAMSVFNFVDQDLGGLSNWVTTHQPQIIGFFTSIGTEGVSVFAALTHVIADFVQAGADVASVVGKIVEGVDRFRAWSNRMTGHGAEADELDRQADAAGKWGDSFDHVAANLYHAEDAMKGFQTQLQAIGDRANAAAQLTSGLGDAAEDLSVKGKDVVLDIKDNTPEVRDRLGNLHIDLVKIGDDPTHLKLMPDTDQAAAQVEAWRSQQAGEPINVKLQPDPASNAAFSDFFNQYRTMLVAPPTPTAAPAPAIPSLLTTPPIPHAAGAVYGGKRRGDAHMMEARPGFVQWAEPATGGEAYIPFDGSERSRALWFEAGKRMGLIAAHQTGAVTGGGAGAYTQGLTRAERAANAFADTINKAKSGFDGLTETVSKAKSGDIGGTIDTLRKSVEDLKPVAENIRTGAGSLERGIDTAVNSSPSRPTLGRPSLRGLGSRLRGRDYTGALDRTRDLGESLDQITTDTGVYGGRLPGLDPLGHVAAIFHHGADIREHIRGRNAGGLANTTAAAADTVNALGNMTGFDLSHITKPIQDVATQAGTAAMTVEGLGAALGALAPEAGAAVAAAAWPVALVAGAAYGTVAGASALTHHAEINPWGHDYDPAHLNLTSVLSPQRQAQIRAQQRAPQTLEDIPNPLIGPQWAPPEGAEDIPYVATPGSLDPFSALMPPGSWGGSGNAGVGSWFSSRGSTTQPHGPAPPTTGGPPKPPWALDLPGSQWGGPINGPGPRGVDSQLIVAAPGEHMWPVPDVDAAGGHAGMFKLRAMARAGLFQGLEGGGPVQGGGAGRGAMLSNLYRYVMSQQGTPYSNSARTDCSGMASRIANVALGLPPVPSFTTRNEGEWLVSHGFQLGSGPPGTLRIGWYNHGSGTMDGHTAVTLPDGVHAESGGAHGGFLVGSGAAGAEDSEFDQQAWLPMNPQGTQIVDSGGGGMTGGAGGPGAAPAGGGGGMVGVNGGGGGGGAGGGMGFGGAGGGNSKFGMSQISQLGQIANQFAQDTFGVGTLLPDPTKIPGFDFLFGLLNGLIGGNVFPGGQGSFGVLGGILANQTKGSGDGGGMAGVNNGDLGFDPGVGGGDGGNLPSDIGIPGMPGAAQAGAPPPPGGGQMAPITVNVHGKNDTDIINGVRREMQWAPRVQTYTAPSVAGAPG